MFFIHSNYIFFTTYGKAYFEFFLDLSNFIENPQKQYKQYRKLIAEKTFANKTYNKAEESEN